MHDHSIVRPCMHTRDSGWHARSAGFEKNIFVFFKVCQGRSTVTPFLRRRNLFPFLFAVVKPQFPTSSRLMRAIGSSCSNCSPVVRTWGRNAIQYHRFLWKLPNIAADVWSQKLSAVSCISKNCRITKIGCFEMTQKSKHSTTVKFRKPATGTYAIFFGSLIDHLFCFR